MLKGSWRFAGPRSSPRAAVRSLLAPRLSFHKPPRSKDRLARKTRLISKASAKGVQLYIRFEGSDSPVRRGLLLPRRAGAKFSMQRRLAKPYKEASLTKAFSTLNTGTPRNRGLDPRHFLVPMSCLYVYGQTVLLALLWTDASMTSRGSHSRRCRDRCPLTILCRRSKSPLHIRSQRAHRAATFKKTRLADQPSSGNGKGRNQWKPKTALACPSSENTAWPKSVERQTRSFSGNKRFCKR
jgi:hypothetical protein